MHALLENTASRKLVLAVLAALGLFLLALALTQFKQFGYVGTDIAPQSTILVTGNAERFVIPDEAEFTFSIIEEATTVAKTQAVATAKVNEVTAYLEDAGVRRDDIKTINYSVYPRYEYRNEAVSCSSTFCPPSTGLRELVGYEVNQTIRVKTTKIDDVGALISGVGTRGISQVSSVSFVVANEEEILKDVRDDAIKDARDEAKRIVRSLGTRLGRVVGYSEQGYYPYTVRSEFGYSTSDEATQIQSPDISAGENRLSATVTVTFELK